MQTFLPYPEFAKSVATLDKARLGKQRVEGYQLLLCRFELLPVRDEDGEHLMAEGEYLFIPGKSSPSRVNHPACKMWKEYEIALMEYSCHACLLWSSIGCRDSCFQKIVTITKLASRTYCPDKVEYPSWLGDPAFHLSHQSNLIRKDAKHYSPQFPGVPSDLPYVWPA